MISCDTNILFAACDLDSSYHTPARAFLAHHTDKDDFCLCEQTLLELYCLLRNPAVSRPPLSAAQAVGVVTGLRSNTSWRIVDVMPGQGIMERVWKQAGQEGFPYRRVFDLRLAFTLLHHGVTDFATRNTKDFLKVGFTRVWDPILTPGK